MVANLFDSFLVLVPAAVEAEIMARPVGAPAVREYPYQTLFRQLRGRMQDEPADAPPPLPILGSGEASAISLAQYLHSQHQRVTLLINEHRGAVHARNVGLPVLAVPTFVVVLRSRGIISDRAARRKLQLITPITAATYISHALRLLDRLSHQP